MATKFITVSIEIMHDKNLTPNQKFILAEIEQLTTLDKGCVASNSHFADLIGITSQGVSKAINQLAENGYITIDNAQTKRNFGRVITINCGKSAINYRKSAINCGLESKENKTSNKTINNEYASIIAHLNETTHKRFSTKSKTNINLIKARMNEGFTHSDFINVIDAKSKEWMHNEKMSKYLRPETLFGSKFDKYLNELPTKRTSTPKMMIGGIAV